MENGRPLVVLPSVFANKTLQRNIGFTSFRICGWVGTGVDLCRAQLVGTSWATALAILPGPLSTICNIGSERVSDMSVYTSLHNWDYTSIDNPAT